MERDRSCIVEATIVREFCRFRLKSEVSRVTIEVLTEVLSADPSIYLQL